MKIKFILVGIILLAAFLRLWQLGLVPPSPDWDEAALGYNAYSIRETGKDEYGVSFPIILRSFDDYKPPMYMYLNVPSVAIFGLTPFAARLPSAIFGFLTVPVIYFLTKKLFDDPKFHFSLFTFHFSLAHVSALMLAISPWHIQFSRVGFEATVGLFFAVAAVTAFLYGITRPRLLILSGVTLGLSSYTYHTERIFVPLVFIATFIIWKKEIFKIAKKYLFFFALITILISLPLVVLIPPKVILQRFEVTTGRPKLEDIEKSIKFIHQDNSTRISKIVHNRRFVIGQTYFANYLSHFDFNFLFTKGDDNLRHHIDNMGMLYLFEMPLILLALFNLVRYKTKQFIFILAWLIIAPIAASPATPNPHGNRSLPMVIALEICSTYGLFIFVSSRFHFKKTIVVTYSLWILLSFLIYLHNYWSHYPYDKASFWQYGYKEAVQETENLKASYEKIDIDHSLEQGYIFWLFNTKYDPKTYQESGSRYHFDKFYFDVKPEKPNELFVASAGSFPANFEVTKIIFYPDGTPAIKIGSLH